MAIAAAKKQQRIVVSRTVHPHYREVLETLFSGCRPSRSQSCRFRHDGLVDDADD